MVELVLTVNELVKLAFAVSVRRITRGIGILKLLEMKLANSVEMQDVVLNKDKAVTLFLFDYEAEMLLEFINNQLQLEHVSKDKIESKMYTRLKDDLECCKCTETKTLKEIITLMQEELVKMVEEYGTEKALQLSQEVDKLIMKYYNSKESKAD